MSRFLAILAIAGSLLLFTPPPALAHDSNVQSSHARHRNLVLSLRVQTFPDYGSMVSASARLTNRGHTAWRYLAGCVPPVLQIQARDSDGHHIYGWQAPRIRCMALALRFLPPGASIRLRAHFDASTATIYVHALAELFNGRPRSFQTPDLKVEVPTP